MTQVYHNPNEKFNKFAADRFEAIKAKMKFDLGTKVIQSVSQEQNTKPITLTQDKVDEMLSAPIKNYPEEQRAQMVAVAGESDYVDNVFEYIDSLELSPNLSMAIALIISANKSRDKEELKKAIICIQGEF